MSYISTIRRGDNVLVWERNEEEGRDLKTYPAPFYLYVDDPDGEYTSMYGDTLERHDFDNSRDFRFAKNQFRDRGYATFESDIPPELKVLSQEYYGVEPPKLHITFHDIEVDYNPELGFSSPENPYAPINSVALLHHWKKEYVILAVPPENRTDLLPDPASDEFMKKLNDVSELPEGYEIKVTLCLNEKELLIRYLVEIEDSDLLCGWNSDFFDMPYIGRRLEKIGKKNFDMLSFPEGDSPKWRPVKLAWQPNQEVFALDLSGRINSDYLSLFRKYEYAMRPSYKLQAIADEILPHLPKLEYEGSLHNLYRNDFEYFVRYNLRDTEILGGLEDRLGYVDLANLMFHLSTGVYKHVTGTLKLAELATINYCHHEMDGLIVNDNNTPDEDEQIQGALVLHPKKGMHEWIGSIDINSLYPSAIRSINISPERLMGQFEDEVEASNHIAKNSAVLLTFEFDDTTQVPEKVRGKRMILGADQWREQFEELKWSVSGFGTAFDQNKPGIIPTILAEWYDMRKVYQKQKAEAHGVDSQRESYYDRLQYVFKIKLNSFYGALTNKHFRFYDLRMGESTTGTGRMILRHQCAKANEVLTGDYNLDGECVIYGDTDSTYFETKAKTKEKAIAIADGVAEIVNDSFQEFMQNTFLCQPEYDSIIRAGREIVSDRGIFVDKKRYILHLVDLDGYPVEKMKIMGLDTKKTTLPIGVRNTLNGFIEDLLKGKEWDELAREIVDFKEHLRALPSFDIGLPKGIKGIEKYTQELKAFGQGVRLPGHVAASILYNICREKFNDKESIPITSGMKIKVFCVR